MFRRLLPIFSILCLITFSGRAQEKKVSLIVEKKFLSEILKEIEAKTDFSFVYGEDISLKIFKSASIHEAGVEEVLSTVFYGTGIGWQIMGQHIILKKLPGKIKLSGYIYDKASGETLIGASVVEIGGNKYTISNNYGYFSITLWEGAQQIRISYVGYQSVDVPLQLTKDTVVHLSLEQNAWLKEVVITDKFNKTFSPTSGSVELSMEDIKYTPSVFGETDVLKVLQLLPGVQSGAEGSAGIYVRGGGPDQNLILLDGVNVYNTNHLY